jgi:two-component system response regulator LytT
MDKIKIGVVEDEVVIADNICEILTELGYEPTEPAVTYTEALLLIKEEEPDLMLLDINLAGKKDGIELAGTIREQYNMPIIFLTANTDSGTLERAKKVKPNAYLVKPFTKEELYTSIEICLSNFSGSTETGSKQATEAEETRNYVINDAIFIRDGYNFVKVLFQDIYYLQAEHVYIRMVAKNKSYLIRSSLRDYVSHFPTGQFFRIGRSHVLNIQHIEKLDGSSVTVNGTELPLSKNSREELMQLLRIG